MIIATRVLKLHRPAGNVEVPIRIFAPERVAVDWSCEFEIDWPDQTIAMKAGGVDSVQALLLAMQMIGAFLYSSDHHKSGDLMWDKPGRGYGFPITNGLRDMLIGDDKKLV